MQTPTLTRSAQNGKTEYSISVSRNYFSILVLFGIIIFSIIYVIIQIPNDDNVGVYIVDQQEQTKRTYEDPGNSWSINHLSIEDVEKIEWGPHLQFTSKLVSMREPFILTNSVYQNWKARDLWKNTEYLQNHPAFAWLVDVKEGIVGTMSDCNQSRPLAHIVDDLETFTLVNISGPEFFRKIHDPTEKYYYYYGKFPEALKADITPNNFLWVGDDDLKASELYIWIGGPGIGPGLHYDMDHNIFIQMVGRKRFILFPPWETKNIYPNPAIHPCNRKSQIDFDDPDLNIFPNFKKAKALQALLEPGDLLYIPPFWWHKVHSLTSSVSLSALSASGIYHKLHKLYKRKFIIDNISLEKKITATVVFINELLKELFGDSSEEFVPNLLKIRWDPIAHYFEESRQIFCENSEEFDLDISIFENDVQVTVEALKTCQLLYGIPIEFKRIDMQAIMETEVSDFIEIISANTVGVENVYWFLKYCF